MSRSSEFHRIFRNDQASAAMGVRVRTDSAGSTEFAQDIVPRLIDDPKATAVYTYGALIDACVGSAVFRESANDQFFVGSRFALNWTNPIPESGELIVTSSLLHRDPVAGTALASAEIRHDGVILGRALCRGVAVGPIAASTEQLPIDPIAPPEGPHSLGLSLETPSPSPGVYRGTWTPDQWMANGLGDVQGGIVLGVAAALAEGFGTRHSPAGRNARLLDIDVNVLGSPVIGDTYDISCRIVRMGRRIGVLAIDILDGGRCIVYGSAQVIVG